MRAFAPFILFALVATAAPAFAVVRDGDPGPSITFESARKPGTQLSTDAYKGKPLYINFFATWCTPCNDEAPAGRGFAQKYAKRGLNVVGIDELENHDKALQFAKQYNWPFPIGLDDDGAIVAKYGSVGLPVHVFIDRTGKVRTIRFGQMDPPDIEDAIKRIL